MKKFYLNLFVLLTLIAVLAATFDKQKNNCHFYKRNALNKRTKAKKCSCTLAEAIFIPKVNGVLKGLIVFAQDEYGHTTITGLFSKGFKDLTDDICKTIKFEIIDDCDNVIYDITKGLNVQFTGDGDTEPFRHRFHDINLDCNDNDILPKCEREPINFKISGPGRRLGNVTIG